MVKLETEDDANLMEELGISINLNIAACWSKVEEFELLKCQCSIVDSPSFTKLRRCITLVVKKDIKRNEETGCIFSYLYELGFDPLKIGATPKLVNFGKIVRTI